MRCCCSAENVRFRLLKALTCSGSSASEEERQVIAAERTPLVRALSSAARFSRRSSFFVSREPRKTSADDVR